MTRMRFLISIFLLNLGISSAFAITPIPIRFLPYSKLPIIEVEIEGKKYNFELDTGASSDIILRKEVLEQVLNKQFQATAKIFDIKGNLYESSEFLITNLKIASVNFNNILAREENKDLITEGCILWNTSKKHEKDQDQRLKNIAGRIGWGILTRHQWFFDFSHSTLWLLADKDELKNEVNYFSPSEYVEIPFEVGKAGIIFSVETDIGIKKLILDTGANISCLKQSLVEKKYAKEFKPGLWMYLTKVRIGKLQFGEVPFFLYDFTSRLDADGVLSVQFFEKNGIYLDFENNKALVGPAKQSFWSKAIDRVVKFWNRLTYSASS